MSYFCTKVVLGGEILGVWPIRGVLEVTGLHPWVP